MYNESCNFLSNGEMSYRESLKEKVKSTICCFRTPPLIYGVPMEPLPLPLEEMKSRTASPRSPHVIKYKCKHLIHRMGMGSRKHYHSADFSYNPMSYALNFEDKLSRDDELPIINFMSRLPATPERTSEVDSLEETPVPVRREVFANS